MSNDYCADCMKEARRIGAPTGQNVSEVYRYFRTGAKHHDHAAGSGDVGPLDEYRGQ